ncbi:hypothetical protein [Olleya sp. R77988]|uniref:hypothetical protein n=1 Tax=Olleya sp. R77988 TaxID=3093875 RepID=UPI0037C85AC8
MKGLSKSELLLIISLNLVIAIAYYIDNLNASYSELSSDIQNIIPVAQKFDDPELFKEDLYLNTIDNVKYYTPFYVQSLRFIAKFTNYNYVQAINVLGLICHLLFGVLWFFLLYKYVNSFWVAFLVSIIIRGVVWLPGLEIWGISDLWTIMPRTVYITLLPLPFLLISKSFFKLLIAGFLIGLIFNFHPITGLGGILLFISFLVLIPVFNKSIYSFSFKKLLLILISIALGMLPFVLTYFGKTSSEITYDVNAFNVAFNARIPEFFSHPLLFLKQWISFKILFFIIPLFIYYFVSFKRKTASNNAKLLLSLTLILVAIPTLSVPIEQLVNKVFNLNLRLSFQLIRVQKVAIIPGFFAIALLLKNVFKSQQFLQKVQPLIVGLYLVVLVFSQSQWFKKIPFFGDDISKTILPHNLSAFSTEKNAELDIDRMAKYLEKHTLTTDLICGSHIYRGATQRSVIFDGKGASMLIEGNPEQFIYWQQQQQAINNLKNYKEIVDYLKQYKVDYFLTKNKDVPAKLVHTEGDINLYKL